jgi:endonuclease/exonuclease/phosphatase family metal-dependent hydrolase
VALPLHRPAPMATLRVMTYNVRQCTVAGACGAIERVAAVIAEAAPDVVALQEVAVHNPRAGAIDQAAELGRALSMYSHFQPSLSGLERGAYGNAILTRAPFRLMRGGLLPLLPGRSRREPRGATWLALAGDAELHVLATHLGLSRRERHSQVDALLGPEWLGDPRCGPPRVLLGDLNFVPGAREHQRLGRVLRDALQTVPPAKGHLATFPSLRPLVRLDHVFVSDDVEVRHAEVLRAPGLRRVSDHLPVVVDLEVAAPGPGAASEPGLGATFAAPHRIPP